MPENKFTSILVISEIDSTTVNDARKLFFGYKEKKVILDGLFDDDRWHLSDEYATYNFNFILDEDKYKSFGSRMNIEADKFKTYMKTFILCQMGTLALVSLRNILHCMKEVSYCKKNELQAYFEKTDIYLVGHLSDFFSILPQDGREAEVTELLDTLDRVEDCSAITPSGGQRSLASFESYFRFDDIIKRFWKESTDPDERLFFFPVWLWWNISGILPLRPREIVLTPRDCLSSQDGEYYLTIRRSRIKGSRKTKSYNINDDYTTMRYNIPSRLAREIQWYIDRTKEFRKSDIRTLFVTKTHYARWKRSAPYTSRYFTYVNLTTCLKYFFQMIVCERFGYKILFEKSMKLSNEKEIEYFHLGDTRHIAMINMIAEGATPMVAMMLAGHDNPEMSSHYYSNITTLIECRTYRQYKKLTKGKQNYAISTSQPELKAKTFTILEDGSRCYSDKIGNNDFSDCYKAAGPSGEIGFCPSCIYHRDEGKALRDSKELYQNRIVNECKLLEQIVKKVRTGKGEPEEIISVLLRLRDSDYSYQQYLLETMEAGENVQKEIH